MPCAFVTVVVVVVAVQVALRDDAFWVMFYISFPVSFMFSSDERNKKKCAHLLSKEF